MLFFILILFVFLFITDFFWLSILPKITKPLRIKDLLKEPVFNLQLQQKIHAIYAWILQQNTSEELLNQLHHPLFALPSQPDAFNYNLFLQTLRTYSQQQEQELYEALSSVIFKLLTHDKQAIDQKIKFHSLFLQMQPFYTALEHFLKIPFTNDDHDHQTLIAPNSDTNGDTPSSTTQPHSIKLAEQSYIKHYPLTQTTTLKAFVSSIYFCNKLLILQFIVLILLTLFYLFITPPEPILPIFIPLLTLFTVKTIFQILWLAPFIKTNLALKLFHNNDNFYLPSTFLETWLNMPNPSKNSLGTWAQSSKLIDTLAKSLLTFNYPNSFNQPKSQEQSTSLLFQQLTPSQWDYLIFSHLHSKKIILQLLVAVHYLCTYFKSTHKLLSYYFLFIAATSGFLTLFYHPPFNQIFTLFQTFFRSFSSFLTL